MAPAARQVAWLAVAAALVAASVPAQPARATGNGLSWAGHTFRSVPELCLWLSARAERCDRWATRHPAAWQTLAVDSAQPSAPPETPLAGYTPPTPDVYGRWWLIGLVGAVGLLATALTIRIRAPLTSYLGPVVVRKTRTAVLASAAALALGLLVAHLTT